MDNGVCNKGHQDNPFRPLFTASNSSTKCAGLWHRGLWQKDVILCRHHPKIPGVCTNDILCNTGRLNSTLSKLYWCPVVRAMTPGGSLATGQNSQQWNTAQYRYPPGIVESTASILYSSIAGWWYWFRVYQRDTSRSTCRQCKQLVFMLFFSSFYNILISVHSMHGSGGKFCRIMGR